MRVVACLRFLKGKRRELTFATGEYMRTPWGESDSRIKVQDGVYWVGTPSHGGFMVALGVAKTYLTQQAREKAEVCCGYLCFEEDCLASIVLFEHPELFDAVGIVNRGAEELFESLSFWEFDYLLARGIEPEAGSYARGKESRAEMEAHFHRVA